MQVEGRRAVFLGRVRMLVLSFLLLAVFFLPALLDAVHEPDLQPPRVWILTAALIMAVAAIVVLVLLFWLSSSLQSISGVHAEISIVIGAVALPSMFATLYALGGSSCVEADVEMLHRDYLYFSYTTYTTLGYGDLLPIGWCRLVTSVQAMTGYVFMAYLAALFLRRFQEE